MNRFILLFLYSIFIVLLCAGGSNKYDSTAIAFTDKENSSYQEEYISIVPETILPAPSPSPIISSDSPEPIIIETLSEENETDEEHTSSAVNPEPQPKISQLTGWYVSQEKGIKVPILMYHNLLEGNAPGDSLNVSAEVFDDQMYYLKAHGYNTITFSDLYNHYMNGLPLAENPLIITFDDGYA